MAELPRLALRECKKKERLKLDDKLTEKGQKLSFCSITDGDLDPYQGYRALHQIWCANNAAIPELRPLFRIPGIEPDGMLNVTDEFRTEVRALATKISGQL